MRRVVTGHAVSADGCIAGPGDGPGRPLGTGGDALFRWYLDGDVPSRFVPGLRMDPVSAAFFDRFTGNVGAVVTGRRTYEIAGGWDGGGPLPGRPLVVLSHRPAPASASADQTFVAGGIDEAIAAARSVAGGGDVALQGSGTVRAALAAGRLDALALSVVPVVLGAGVRLLDGVTAELRTTEVVAAPGVTHLVYDVLR